MSDPSTEPIRLLEVDVENIGQPRGGSGRGSALYAVPIKLSRTPSSTWADLFPKVWDSPPEYTNMHRPGIARVSGARIILDGTTVEEVRDVHARTLQIVVAETNKAAADAEQRAAAAREQEAEQREAHDRNVRDIGSDIRFE
jgi:hypothetical protein